VCAARRALVKILVVFGTRPEAIKLAPLVAELRRRPGIDVTVALTAQHRQLLDQVLDVFDIRPAVDLALMRPMQTLAELSSRVLTAVDELITRFTPDLVIVQGDTTSALISAMAAFYRGVPVAHVEAGLRTSSLFSPFPEEMNRRGISLVAMLHFAPTDRGRQSLLSEGVAPDAAFVTGNTVVDALQRLQGSDRYRLVPVPVPAGDNERLILVTIHRRESWSVLPRVAEAIRSIVEQRPQVRVVIPVHPNPIVQDAFAAIESHPRVSLIAPLDYFGFIKQMQASEFVMSDSGGVQEEAPVLGRPVLVLRDTTERPEAVEQGVARLVGTEPQAIVAAALTLLDDAAQFQAMSRAVSPFGDGKASHRIADLLQAHEKAIQEYARRPGNPRAFARA